MFIVVSFDGCLLVLICLVLCMFVYVFYDICIEVWDIVKMWWFYWVFVVNGDGKMLLFSFDSCIFWLVYSGMLYYDVWMGKLVDNCEGSDGVGVSVLVFVLGG